MNFAITPTKREELSRMKKIVFSGLLAAAFIFVLVFALGVNDASAMPNWKEAGLTNCAGCHDDGRTPDNPTGAKKAEPAEEAAPAEETTPANTSTAKSDAVPGSIRHTVNLVYGDAVVKIDAANKNGHLYVPAGTLAELLGFSVNDENAMVSLAKTAKDLGLMYDYKQIKYQYGEVNLYGAAEAKGAYGRNESLALPNYVGSDTCQKCHSDVADKWMTTDHSTMLQDFNDPDAYIMGDFRTNSFFSEEDVEYAVAQGKRFLTTKDGILQYMPATWNPETGMWNEGAWSAYGCAECHSTGFNEVTGYWYEEGVTCESCHGPGAEHVATMDPSKIRVNAGVEMCQPCHDEGSHNQVTLMLEDAAAEQADDAANKSHLNVLKDSKTDPNGHYGDGCTKCHSAEVRLANEKGEEAPTWDELKDGPRYGITCVVCHDPHQKTGNIRQLKQAPEELCIDCHTTDEPVTSGNSPHHPQKEWFEAKVIGIENAPEAPTGHECATCHMPVGNHDFEVGKPEAPVYEYLSHGHEEEANPCVSCHVEKDVTVEAVSAIQASVQATYEELEHQLEAFAAKLEAAKAAGAEVTDAQALYDANYTNLHFVEAEGSWGIHNNDLTEAVFEKAKKDFAALESLLSGY